MSYEVFFKFFTKVVPAHPVPSTTTFFFFGLKFSLSTPLASAYATSPPPLQKKKPNPEINSQNHHRESNCTEQDVIKIWALRPDTAYDQNLGPGGRLVERPWGCLVERRPTHCSAIFIFLFYFCSLVLYFISFDEVWEWKLQKRKE